MEPPVAEHHEPVVLPPRRPIGGAWDFMVRGYRPTAAWAGVATIITFGIVKPIAELTGLQTAPTDWLGVSSFIAVVFGPIVVTRTFEKWAGVTS